MGFVNGDHPKVVGAMLMPGQAAATACPCLNFGLIAEPAADVRWGGEYLPHRLNGCLDDDLAIYAPQHHQKRFVQLDIAQAYGQVGRRSSGAARLRGRQPRPVLVLSQYVEPSYAPRLIQEQPERVGYLLKERVFDITTVVDALRRIVDGETVIDPTIVSRLSGGAAGRTHSSN
jgi:hypothetical protein